MPLHGGTLAGTEDTCGTEVVSTRGYAAVGGGAGDRVGVVCVAVGSVIGIGTRCKVN